MGEAVMCSSDKEMHPGNKRASSGQQAGAGSPLPTYAPSCSGADVGRSGREPAATGARSLGMSANPVRLPRTVCPSCGREIALTARGQYYVHADTAGNGCPTSWTHPLSPTTDPGDPSYIRRAYPVWTPRGLRGFSAAFELDPSRR